MIILYILKMNKTNKNYIIGGNMNKFRAIFMSFFIFFALSNISFAEHYEMRGSWITTVYNKDWPSKSSYKNVEKQKQEFINILDQLKSSGLNTVVVQVRTEGDALYKSDINPWSKVLTGVQGEDPMYDPLKFMVEEAHKRGMKIHAWLNPYRVTTSGTNLDSLSKDHPARKNPDWVIYHNNAIYYDPSNSKVKNHIVDTVKEIVKNYDVDAIHFDDYFYPEKYPLPENETKDGTVANQRRNHVNEMVKMVNDAIKSIDSSVEFGISPSGIWKNKSSDPTGSDTRGNESYYSVFADTRTWIKNGWIDYVVPQIYWNIGNKAADYDTLAKWWNNEVSGTNVDLYIGQGIYKEEVRLEIKKQIELNRKLDNIKGSIYYTTSDIIQNTDIKNDFNDLYESGWIYKNGKWYLLDSIGNKKTGWHKLSGKWYYLNGSGEMQTGWLRLGNKWYYLNGSGEMQTGWLLLGDKWYYLNGSGEMQTGWLRLGSKWYYLNGSGEMKTGWLLLGNKWYYLNGSGEMQTGWLRLGSKWYYLNGSGEMQTGWLNLNEKRYYLQANGAMVTGKVKIDGKEYNFNLNGELIQ